MIETLGSRLKDKRKELNLTIEEVVEKTKLHPGMIREIEEGNLDKINPTYLKGFIRIYASFLGVDIGNALSEVSGLTTQKNNIVKRRKPQITPASSQKFTPTTLQKEKAVPIIPEGTNVDIAAKRKTDKVLPVKVRKVTLPAQFKKVIGFSLLVIIILCGVTLLGKFAVNKVGVLVKDRKAARERKEVIPDKVNLPKAVNTPKVTHEVVPQDIDVALTVKKNCFLRVKVDGKLLFEGILRKGAVETWKGRKEIEFKMSDGSAVYLEVNGKPIPSLTSMNKPVKSLKITPSGISVDK